MTHKQRQHAEAANYAALYLLFILTLTLVGGLLKWL